MTTMWDAASDREGEYEEPEPCDECGCFVCPPDCRAVRWERELLAERFRRDEEGDLDF